MSVLSLNFVLLSFFLLYLKCWKGFFVISINNIENLCFHFTYFAWWSGWRGKSDNLITRSTTFPQSLTLFLIPTARRHHKMTSSKNQQTTESTSEYNILCFCSFIYSFTSLATINGWRYVSCNTNIDLTLGNHWNYIVDWVKIRHLLRRMLVSCVEYVYVCWVLSWMLWCVERMLLLARTIQQPIQQQTHLRSHRDMTYCEHILSAHLNCKIRSERK